MKLDHKDVQLAYFKGGTDEVLKLVDSGEVSRFTVRRALRGIREDDGKDGYDALLADLEKRGISLDTRPSKSKPSPGDVRSYRVQKAKGSLFIRLPVWHLEVEAGEEVTAHFFVGSVKVEAGPLKTE